MKKSEKLDIIYEDKNLLVVNKPAHLLTIATADEKINTLYHKAFEYIKKKNKNNKIFIVHRLDKDTSGIVLFAKSQELKEMLQNDWNNLAATREYILSGKDEDKAKKGFDPRKLLKPGCEAIKAKVTEMTKAFGSYGKAE